MSKLDVMEAFGDKAFLLLQLNDQIIGLAGWQVENLVARTTDLYIEPAHMSDKALEILISEVESASHDLQCEASLIFPLPRPGRLRSILESSRLSKTYARKPRRAGLARCCG